jgi:hypothetical protein
VSDGSHPGPEQKGGEKDKGQVSRSRFVVAGGDGSELLEATEAAFDDIASRVGSGVEAWRTTGPMRPMTAMVGPLGQDMLEFAMPEPAAIARITVAPVGQHPVGPRPRAAPTHTCHADAAKHGRELGRVIGLSTRQHHRQRTPAAIAGQMQLCTQATSAVPERLVGGEAPLFRAPAAC